MKELKCKLILRFLEYSEGKLSSNALFFIVRLLNKSIFEIENTCGSVYHHFSKLEKHKIFITAAKMFKPMKTIQYNNSVWNNSSIMVPMIWALAAKIANSKCFIPSILSHTALQKPYPSCCQNIHLIGKNYSSCSYIGNCLSNLIQLKSYQSKFKCPNLFCQPSTTVSGDLNTLETEFSQISLWHFSTFSRIDFTDGFLWWVGAKMSERNSRQSRV